MLLKRSFLAIFTGIFFWLSLPSLGMENSLGTKALAIASNHKGKLALAMSLLAGYQLYKKYQKELKPLIDEILLNKDMAFSTTIGISPIALSLILQDYLCYKQIKNSIGGLDAVLGFYFTFIPSSVVTYGMAVLSSKFFNAIDNTNIMHQAINSNNYARVKFLSYILGTNHHSNMYSLPIIQAIRDNKIHALKALLSRYDCVINDTIIDIDIIEFIILNRYTEILDLLVKNSLQFDPNMRLTIGNNLEPAIFYAYHFYQPKMVKLLIDLGADTSVTDNAGNTIYDCMNMMPEMYKDILTERKARISKEVDAITEFLPQRDLANIVAEYVV